MKVVFTPEFKKSLKRLVWRRRLDPINPKNHWHNFQHFYQQGRKGYSYRTYWNLDWHLYLTIPPVLRELAEKSIGFPADIHEEASDKQFEEKAKEWTRQLLKAADDIEAYMKQEEKDFPKTKKAQDKYFADMKEAQERTRAGFHWIADNIFTLWD